jgi:hypothetical protein
MATALEMLDARHVVQDMRPLRQVLLALLSQPVQFVRQASEAQVLMGRVDALLVVDLHTKRRLVMVDVIHVMQMVVLAKPAVIQAHVKRVTSPLISELHTLEWTATPAQPT